QGQPAADREIPEGTGHHALAATLGGDPLHEEARGEESLADESDGEPQLLNGHVTPSSRRPIVKRSRRRAAEVASDGELGRAAEHRAKDVVSFADVLRTTPSRDQREDLLGFFGRHGAVLVADVGQITQRNLERDRHTIETVDRDRLLAAFDFADEFSAESGSFAESFLAERALFAKGAEALAEEFPDVLDGALCHGTVILLIWVTLTTFPWFGNRWRTVGASENAVSFAVS